MNSYTFWVELLMAGFFATACFRARKASSVDGTLRFRDFFRFTGRIDRLRQTRWQWFSMVAVLLVIRLQQPVPLVVEGLVGAQFLLFMALPAAAEARPRA